MDDESPLDRIEATRFPAVYEDLGVDLLRPGCVMLETEAVVVSDVVAERDLHRFDPMRYPYARALASEPSGHVSLRYGLLRPGPELRTHIDAVLAGWRPDDLLIERVESWPRRETTDRDHVSILGRLAVTENLLEAHYRLSLLPHIDVHGPFRPHITFAHVRPTSDWHSYTTRLQPLAGRTVAPRGISYGD